MKRVLILTIFILTISTPGLFALTGRQVMEENAKLQKPKSAKSHVIMLIKRNRLVEKEYTRMQKSVEGQDRILITFLRPERIKFLTHANKDREDDQWMKLRSGKIKKIFGEEKSLFFVDSHITYEDLASRKIDDYQYSNPGIVTVMGFQCYKVEAIPTKIAKSYDKVYFYLRTSDYYLIKIDFSKNGGTYRTLENSDLKTIDGIITPMKTTVKMTDNSGYTELSVKKIIYNMDIPASTFDKEALR
jgi:hypothetical protein